MEDSAPDIMRVISSKEIEGRVMWHVCGYLYTWFRWGNLRVGGHLKDLGVEGRVVLTCEFKQIYLMGVDWIDLAQDKEKFQNLLTF